MIWIFAVDQSVLIEEHIMLSKDTRQVYRMWKYKDRSNIYVYM